MDMKKLRRGGFVVTPRGARRADVLLDGEKIAQVGHISPAEAKSAEVTDVSGCYLFPGFIDAHTHFDLDVCNTTTADDFASGTRSAIRGGTTTIIDFACPNKGETLAYGLDLWHKKADGKCSCDYGFHMTIDDWNEGIEGELDNMFAAGITSFKMYLTYPAMMIGDGAVYSALKALKKRGGIAGVHCENAGVIDARIAELKAAGRAADVSAHPEARPDYLEAEAVARLLRIAEAADAPVIIVHLTNREALDEVAFARARGQRVYVETCRSTSPSMTACTMTPTGRRPRAMSARRPSAPRKISARSGAVCAAARSRPSPPTTARSPSRRRTWAARTSRRSPAVCPAWRRAARSSTPAASPRAE